MATKAHILYDFEGDAENDELNLKEGDIVTILNQDVGDGWWEGQTSDGQVGLFPESYCELYQDDEAGEVHYQQEVEAESYQPQEEPASFEHGEPDWDDDPEWDDQEQPTSTPNKYAGDTYQRDYTSTPQHHSSENITASHGYIKKDLNRFTAYVKTGTESFMLRNLSVKRDVKKKEKIGIMLSPDEECPMWQPPQNPFTVVVKDPEKKKKFKGVVSYVAYQVIPSTTNRPVSRRYKHYDWLHDRLIEKFTLLSVPPLPDKTYQSKFGEDFVEKRREKLQMWTNRLARHPVLSCSQVFQHFLECDDTDQGEWKAGKRRAEKDDMVGGAFMLTVDSSLTVSIQQCEAQMEGFGQFKKLMEESCIKLRDRLQIHSNNMTGPFLQEWHRMANAFHGLGQCFILDNKEYARGLNQAIGFTAETYRDIGTMHSVQPKNDTLPALEVIKEYLGILHEYPDTTDIYRRSLSKLKESDRMRDEGRIDIMEAGELQERSEKVAGVMLAEMFHFQRERVIDFRQMMREMLQEQISFYTEITGKLETALERFNEETNL